MNDDSLVIGRMLADYDDGVVTVVALWWTRQGEVAVMTSQVIDVRECLN